jgi:hypothetical protein
MITSDEKETHINAENKGKQNKFGEFDEKLLCPSISEV